MILDLAMIFPSNSFFAISVSLVISIHRINIDFFDLCFHANLNICNAVKFIPFFIDLCQHYIFRSYLCLIQHVLLKSYIHLNHYTIILSSIVVFCLCNCMTEHCCYLDIFDYYSGGYCVMLINSLQFCIFISLLSLTWFVFSSCSHPLYSCMVVAYDSCSYLYSYYFEFIVNLYIIYLLVNSRTLLRVSLNSHIQMNNGY